MSEEDKKEEKKDDSEKRETKTEDDHKEIAVPEKFKALVEQIEQMSVLELSELVKILEDKFGVLAASPMVMAAGGGQAGESEADAGGEEKSTFDVELTEAGSNKIAVIKAVRELTELGLKQAKDLVDGAPGVVKEALAKEEAEEVKKKLEQAGAKVSLK